MDEFILVSFRNHFYASTGRIRKYLLHTLLWALMIWRIFFIPTDQFLLTFLAYSKPLREFCGFSKVPDVSKIVRFKQDFLHDLQLVFDNLVDVAEPIFQAIHSTKADTAIFDSFGIEAFVTGKIQNTQIALLCSSKLMPRRTTSIRIMALTRQLEDWRVWG